MNYKGSGSWERVWRAGGIIMGHWEGGNYLSESSESDSDSVETNHGFWTQSNFQLSTVNFQLSFSKRTDWSSPNPMKYFLYYYAVCGSVMVWRRSKVSKVSKRLATNLACSEAIGLIS